METEDIATSEWYVHFVDFYESFSYSEIERSITFSIAVVI